MLGKLMKYDLRYCLRRFIPLWIAAAALSAICGFYFRVAYNMPNTNGVIVAVLTVLLPLAVFGVFTALSVLTLVFVCERFYRGLLKDEGYLMHTLPVTAGEHIAAKGLVALILEVVTSCVTFISAIVLFLAYDPTVLSGAWQEFMETVDWIQFPAATPWLVAEGLLVCLASLGTETLQIYAAISLGHLARRHRVLWAILAFLGINMAKNILFSGAISTGLVDWIIGAGDWGAMFTDSGMVTFFGLGKIAWIMGWALLWELLLGAGFFLLSRAILQKRLNLE